MSSKHVTIFEGPDGAGKSTIAKEYAAQTGARYVHLPALPRVNQSLARLYVEAVVPALLGYQPVVLDRCWLSETPYGEVHREGRDRLNNASRRMLERLVLRCGAVVVRCLPPLEVCLTNFRARKGQELLKSDQALTAVWGIYSAMQTELPMVTYDYTGDSPEGLYQAVELRRAACHPLDLQSAGQWEAQVVVVGEGFAERKEWDAWYQWPFGSFSGEGCSKWLTEELNRAAIRESDLMWVNADQPLDLLELAPHQQVIALGQVASAACYANKLRAQVIEHPQYWKRFKANQTYPLIQRIYDATAGE
jgi:hypothetical protein